MTRTRINKPKMGAPAYIPTTHDRQTVRGMLTAGFTIKEIAKCLRIHELTVNKAYELEIATTDFKRTGKIANKLYKVALAGDPRAMELYLRKKSRAFKEKDNKLEPAHVSLLASLIGAKIENK